MLISYILPSYKKFSMFVQSVGYNFAYQQPSSEVVIVLDEPSEESAYLKWIEAYGRFVMRPRLIVNDTPHEWRPPCKAINVGIRHSVGKYCAVLSPETILRLPTSNYLTKQITLLESSGGHFYITGVLSELLRHEISLETITDPPNRHYMRQFGFVLFGRTQAAEIGGYDENREAWGYDDDLIRARLKRSGATHISLLGIRALHVVHETEPKRVANTSDASPVTPNGNTSGNFGLDFNRVAYDWRSR